MVAVAPALHSSESAEWYTPPEVVEAATALMGGIDLDPASTRRANQVVGAEAIFTEADNGFVRTWRGRVFLNPPGGRCDDEGRRVVRGCSATGACGQPPGHTHSTSRRSAKRWWEKLCAEYAAGRVEQAVFVGFNAEVLRSTQYSPLSCVSFPFCVPRRRLHFLTSALEPARAPTHMNAVVWLPPRGMDRADAFPRMRKIFGKLGACCVEL